MQKRSIGDNIRRIRLQIPKKQSEVLRELHLKGHTITKSTYSKLENGIRSIAASELVALHEILGADYAEFFEGISSEKDDTENPIIYIKNR